MDTLMALKYVKKMKHKSIVITNSLESSMVREAEVTIPTYAQKEVGVASTKAFTCQLLSLANLALEVGRMEKTISNQIYKMNIGLLTKLRFLIVISELSLTTFPFQRLGLNGLIGEIDSFFEFKLNIGP